MSQRSLTLKRLFFFAFSACVLIGSVVEFTRVAWGTGIWLGQLSFSWALALVLFIGFCIVCVVLVGIALRAPQRLEGAFRRAASVRDRFSTLRWILAAAILLFPVFLLQYSFWGIVLHGPFLRLLLAGLSSVVLGWLLTKNPQGMISWPAALTALVLVSGTYTFFTPLLEVTDYPFSLGWSEGNRLWDYSVLFGRDIYNYPSDLPIHVFLETGRQFVGGLPFLLPDVNIWQVRLWLALVDIIPYLLLGWLAFRLPGKDRWPWLLAGIWAFTFVRQGPIHPPLLLCAIVVALMWGRPLWLAIPVIAITSYFAGTTRFTWMFAPGLWAAMLELNQTAVQTFLSNKRAWGRAISLGTAGVLGGYIAPFWIPGILQWARSIREAPVAAVPGATGEVIASAGVTVDAVNASLSAQPLIWSRLLPNATYGEGILLGLALATLPLILILMYLSRTGRWKLDLWQKLAILLPLFAFLVVGLIVSVKIGGGGDLHNLDMFIIGLMFAGAIAWRNGGRRWIDELLLAPGWVQVMMIALIVIPGYKPLMLMSPLAIRENLQTVARLADIHEDPLPNPLPDTIPSDPDTLKALQQLQQAVADASQRGDVLFMDQRQLLTFEYIKDVPLVPEYDKKVLINEAMSANAPYFQSFYEDLASRRFSLIVTNPVNRRLDRSEGHFAEENNAWVEWVSIPLLCYYEPVDRLKRVDVELLVPRLDISECDQILPIHVTE